MPISVRLLRGQDPALQKQYDIQVDFAASIIYCLAP